MLSPLSQSRSGSRGLTEKDLPMIKHECISAYGYSWWKSVGLDELFEMLPQLLLERSKRESLRICTLKYYGVKNPK